MYELDKTHYDRIRPLVTELAAYNVALPALLDGNNAGRVFVDDLDHPQAAYIETVEGRHLVGDSANDLFIETLRAHFSNNMPGWGIALTVPSDDWLNRLPDLFHPRPVQQVTRRHYVCTALAYDNWRTVLLDGYTVRPINADLLDNPQLDIPDHIRSWIKANWGTPEHFAHHGFGFCTLYGQQVVSWSVADCVSGSRSEIGIHTHEAYRRQGLAAITAAACVEHALTSRFTEVGWHCDDDNTGSWKTAEKVGFQHARNYTLYYCK